MHNTRGSDTPLISSPPDNQHSSGLRRFILIFVILCGLNSAILTACAFSRPACALAIPLNWPAFFVLPDEADELLGRGRVAAISWFVALPWLAAIAGLLANSARRSRETPLLNRKRD